MADEEAPEAFNISKCLAVHGSGHWRFTRGLPLRGWRKSIGIYRKAGGATWLAGRINRL